MTIARSSARLLAAGLCVGGWLGAASDAAATSHRPHRAQSATISRDVDQDTTAAIPARPAAQVPEASAKADDEPLPPPFRLPAASHARMRACGLKWQAMKMSGAAGDDIWRDFATRCLAAANGPAESR